MLVQIGSEKKIVNVTTVTITAYRNNPILQPFFCSRCGHLVTKIAGDPQFTEIMPGMLPDAFPKLDMCVSCSQLYSFQGLAFI